MKRLLLLPFISLLVMYGYSQSYSIDFVNRKGNLNGFTINQSNSQTLNVSINYQGVDIQKVKSEKGIFSELKLQGSYRNGKVGYPQLPSTNKLIQVPFGADVKVSILNYEVAEYNLDDYGYSNKLMPLQPSYPKNMDPSKIDFKFNKDAYNVNKFYSEGLAFVTKIGRMRGLDLAQLSVNPIEYNPVTNTIRVYNNIDVEVTFIGGNEQKTKELASKTASPYFETAYKSVLNSKDTYTEHPDHTKYPIKYLIITAPEFEEQLADFVTWKTKKGFEVIMVTTDEIGSTSSEIKSWLHSQYNAGTASDPAPTFFLLVGDTPQIPASQIGDNSHKATDLYYACVDGNDDILPDMYYGRFSAETSTHLQNMLDKVMYYEKYEFEDASYLNNATLIAGADGTWNPQVGQPTINYGTENYFNESNGFSSVNAYLDSYSGCYVSNNFKVGFMNYTAHCSETSWGDPNLTISDVNGLDNINKYPLAIGNCCLSAEFGTPECIGEAWMRKANGGAVAYIGSSPSSYWYEDFHWSVGAHPIVDGTHPTFEGSSLGALDAPFNSNYLCVDAMLFVGNLAVTEAHAQNYPTHSNPKYYWEAYNCLSDPSLHIYLTEGLDNEVSHLPILPIGLSQYEVTAEPGSYVAISKNGVLYGTALVPESGAVTVDITPITSGGDVDVVVTKHQYKPYMVSIPAAALDGPYLSVNDFVVNDENGNGIVENAEPFNIDLTLKNVGSENSEGIKATITSLDTNVIITNNIDIDFADIAPDASASVTGQFNVAVGSNILDQYSVEFDIVITDNHTGKQEYVTKRSVIINSPEPKIVSVTYNDNYPGNSLVNGIIDAGETGDVMFELENVGHAGYEDLIQSVLSISDGSDYFSINTSMDEVSFNQVTNTVVSFNITASATTPLGQSVPVNLLIKDEINEANLESEVVIGVVPIYVMGEDNVVEACSGTFYDSGNENGGYSINESSIITFKPLGEGNLLIFNFEFFETESGYDKLYVYNGEDENASQFNGSPFSGSQIPSTFIASNTAGAITFKFTSDYTANGGGWKATFDCFDGSALPQCSENPDPANEAVDMITSLLLSWEPVLGAVEYDLYIGETLPTAPTATVDMNYYSVQDLDTYTTYQWKVIPKNMNGEGPEDDCGSWSFTTGVAVEFMSETTLTTCDLKYTDPGGFENYGSSSNVTQTILPGDDEKVISVTFTEFNLEANYDFLYIYDGTSINAPLIGKYSGASSNIIGNNGTVVATNNEGALTFKFTSDVSSNKQGWLASVSCVEPIEMFDAVFKVRLSNNTEEVAVEGVNITINSETLTTDAAGIVTFSLPQGDYDYIAEKDEYETSNGSFNLPNTTDTIEVSLIYVSINETVASNLNVYPNPSTGMFNFEGANVSMVTVYNAAGVVVTKIDRLNNNTINLSQLQDGIYYMNIVTENNKIAIRKISIVK